MFKKLYACPVIVLILAADVSCGLAPEMRISMDRELETMEVRYKTYRALLNFGEEKAIGDAAKVRWNSAGVTLRNGTSAIGEFDLFSEEIPVILDSFSARKCRVFAPGADILGTSHIEEFCADMRSAAAGLLKITGTLATKFLNIFGSAQIDGRVDIAEDGCVALKEFGAGTVTINGQLVSAGILRVDGARGCARIINNGEITSLSGEAFFSMGSFVNGVRGRIGSASVSFELEKSLENFGQLRFGNFTIGLPSGLVAVAALGFNPVSFYQRGIFEVSASATADCNFESFGKTVIGQLVFPHAADLKVSSGQTHISEVSGAVSILRSKDGAVAEIGSLKGGAEFVESLGGKLEIGAITSPRSSVFTSEFGGYTVADRVEAPSSFMFSRDGQIDIKGIGGISTAYASGKGKLRVSGATRLDILSTEHSQSLVIDSAVGRAYLLGDSPGQFFSTTADSVINHGDFWGGDTAIADFQNTGAATFSGETTAGSVTNRGDAAFFGEATVTDLSNSGEVTFSGKTDITKVSNSGEITFSGKTDVTNLSNFGEVTFRSGTHEVRRYFGENTESRLKAEGTVVETSESQREGRVVLRDGDATVRAEQLSGTGTVEAGMQTYGSEIPSGFHLMGNVDAYIDYMPVVAEIPTCSGGKARFHVDLQRDFINTRDVDYGDTVLLMDLHGKRWENRGVLFGAGGLQVYDAAVFGNTDGMISLDEFLDVRAGRIFNVSQPVVRDNSRTVIDRSNWRAELIYQCPAVYYSAPSNTGISVGGDITLRGETAITNGFSSIVSMNGTFNAAAGYSFENTVGNVCAFGKGHSSITAETISNACLPLCLREGSAYGRGRCGWGWTRRTWHAYSHTAEWVTQSPGSAMLFGGDTVFTGHTRNIGSSILSCGLFSGHVDSTSVSENIAQLGSLGTLIDGTNIYVHRGQIFVEAEQR
jgi:hypothetical protein